MTFIEVLNHLGSPELIRVDQIESIGLPTSDKSDNFFHGWVRLVSGRAHGLAKGEVERLVGIIEKHTVRDERGWKNEFMVYRREGIDGK